MIPLARRSSTRARLETTLLSYSRQSLPRPARLYSTPTKRSNAPSPGLGAASTVPNVDFPAYMPVSNEVSGSAHQASVDMQSFLRRRTPYTILPTPLPDDASSQLNDFYFADSPTQDATAVIDACLHNLYDVPRAKGVFQVLRSSETPSALLTAPLYNSVMAAYIEMASTKDTARRNHWVEDACALYEAMEEGSEKVLPTASTYALMLLVWLRFNPEAPEPVSRTVDLFTPKQLLEKMLLRQIPVTLVVTDTALKSSEEAEEIIKLLSRAAVDMNLSKVVTELGAAEVLGRQTEDPLEGVPEVVPVLKEKDPKVRLDYRYGGPMLNGCAEIYAERHTQHGRRDCGCRSHFVASTTPV